MRVESAADVALIVFTVGIPFDFRAGCSSASSSWGVSFLAVRTGSGFSGGAVFALTADCVSGALLFCRSESSASDSCASRLCVDRGKRFRKS